MSENVAKMSPRAIFPSPKFYFLRIFHYLYITKIIMGTSCNGYEGTHLTGTRLKNFDHLCYNLA